MKIIISKDPVLVVCYLGTISFAADERLNTKETLQSFSINNKLWFLTPFPWPEEAEVWWLVEREDSSSFPSLSPQKIIS